MSSITGLRPPTEPIAFSSTHAAERDPLNGGNRTVERGLENDASKLGGTGLGAERNRYGESRVIDCIAKSITVPVETTSEPGDSLARSRM